ncbi:YqjF family protein [Bacillus badius]|uniref:DUF2071 domain-containing protein n=1 Tax=Bacillus badius TaxID=1455 RepID=A0ABR5B057_BACBA|nr:DUF2071 domain-containing protein [Bacillus badius]KIL73346.1 hypothetical protein SD78_3534 [Bacillus badius]KIL80354.1 hypothetical protein SD77_0202 [Bacillus badius]MED4716882.1 DUF2071 domain-containing protein [Bacillus badius]
MHRAFLHLQHRPIPLPSSSWLMTQVWSNVLFMHWPIQPEALKGVFPPSLQIDLYDHTAWVGLVPFQVSNMRFHGLPSIPLFRSFLQLNVRTYVTHQGIPGVYFFSLDVNHLPSVVGARLFYLLPFRQSKMAATLNDSCRFQSSYSFGQEEEELDVCYTPLSSPYSADKGTFDYWATERYCIFTSRGNKLYRGDIHHTRWSLQKADATFFRNTMAPFLPANHWNEQPIVHFSKEKKAFFWPLQKI